MNKQYPSADEEVDHIIEEENPEEELFHLAAEGLVELLQHRLEEYQHLSTAIDALNHADFAKQILDSQHPEKLLELLHDHHIVDRAIQKQQKKQPDKTAITTGVGRFRSTIDIATFNRKKEALQVAVVTETKIQRDAQRGRFDAVQAASGVSKEQFLSNYKTWRRGKKGRTLEEYIFQETVKSEEKKRGKKLSRKEKETLRQTLAHDSREQSIKKNEAVIDRAHKAVASSLDPSQSLPQTKEERKKQLDWVKHGEQAEKTSPSEQGSSEVSNQGTNFIPPAVPVETHDSDTSAVPSEPTTTLVTPGAVAEVQGNHLSFVHLPRAHRLQMVAQANLERLRQLGILPREPASPDEIAHVEVKNEIPVGQLPDQPSQSHIAASPSHESSILAGKIPSFSMSQGIKNVFSSVASKFSALTSKLSAISEGISALSAGVFSKVGSLLGSGLSKVGMKLFAGTALKTAASALLRFAGGPVANAIMLAANLLGVDLFGLTMKVASIIGILVVGIAVVIIMAATGGIGTFLGGDTVKVATRETSSSLSWKLFENTFLVSEPNTITDNHQQSWDQFAENTLLPQRISKKQ